MCRSGFGRAGPAPELPATPSPVTHFMADGALSRFDALDLNRTPAAVVTATPAQGEHSDQVLAELGYAPDEIAALRADGVI